MQIVHTLCCKKPEQNESNSPLTDYPDTDYPDAVKPDTDNPPLLNTNIQKTKLTNYTHPVSESINN